MKVLKILFATLGFLGIDAFHHPGQGYGYGQQRNKLVAEIEDGLQKPNAWFTEAHIAALFNKIDQLEQLAPVKKLGHPGKGLPFRAPQYRAQLIKRIEQIAGARPAAAAPVAGGAAAAPAAVAPRAADRPVAPEGGAAAAAPRVLAPREGAAEQISPGGPSEEKEQIEGQPQ